MKRLIFSLVILFVLSSASATAKEYTADIVGLEEILSDTSAWKTTDKNITLDHEKVIFNSKGFAWNDKYKNANEIIEFDMNTVYDGNWMGIILRATKPDAYPWTGNSCILFVVKEEQIELQIYTTETAGGGYIIQTIENPIKTGTTAKVAVGAIETDAGVQIIFAVDGEIVMNSEFPDIKNSEGYFALMNTGTKTKISIPKTDTEYVIPFNVSVKGEYIAGSELNVEYDTISTSDSKDCEFAWYTKTGEVAQKVGEGDRYKLSNKDLDKYVYVGICEVGKESKSFSPEVFFDSAKVCMKKNIVMLKDWFLAYGNGKQHQIDRDFSIAPVMIKDEIYIPLRFVAEQMGYCVNWNDKDRSVSLYNTINMISVESENLKIINDRSFINKEVFEKSFDFVLYYDANTGVIVIDKEKSFDEMKENIYERLYEYLVNGI